jgi:hypothetical protein
MKRFLTLTLALITTLALAACDTPSVETPTGTDGTTAAVLSSAEETVSTSAETSAVQEIAEEAVAEEAVAEEATPEETVAEAEEAVAEAAAEETAPETTEPEAVTTTVTTTAAATTAKAEPAVCGTYRTVVPIDDVDPASILPEEEMFFYSYINVDQMDDGHFQVEFRDPYGGSDESYAVFDTEALGASQIINFSFDGSGPTANSSAGGAVTITVDGDTAWVTFGDGEPEEYRRTE